MNRLPVILAALLIGCSTPSTSSKRSLHGIQLPAGFSQTPSRVPEVEWKRVFFRLARDIRLLPKLHPHIHDIQVTLLRDQDERTLLFIAHARQSNAAEANFWKAESYRLYQPELKPDFVQIRHYPNRSLIESEAYLQGGQSAKTTIAISDDRRGNVYFVGGSRLVGGPDPFLLDQIVSRMSGDLNR